MKINICAFKGFNVIDKHKLILVTKIDEVITIIIKYVPIPINAYMYKVHKKNNIKV